MLPLLPAALYHRFCSFSLLVALSLIRVSIFLLIPVKELLLLHVLKHWFLLWIYHFSLEEKVPVDLLSFLWVFQISFGVLLFTSTSFFLSTHWVVLLYTEILNEFLIKVCESQETFYLFDLSRCTSFFDCFDLVVFYLNLFSTHNYFQYQDFFYIEITFWLLEA